MAGRMKRLVPVVIALLVLAGGAGYVWWPHDRGTADGVLTLHGNVEIRQVELAFNASDRIARLAFEEGDRVEPGQLLAELETDRARKHVDQAVARVDVQAATLARLEAGQRPQEIEKLRAEFKAARYRADNAARTAQRLARLAERELVSAEAVDNARATADTARAQRRAAHEALQLALAGTRVEEIEAARAQLQAEHATLALARQRLADTRLYAPSAGVIEQRLLEPGDMASPGRPVLTLALTDPLWVRGYIGETDLGRIRPGQRATVHTDSYPDKDYAAWVGYVSPTAEFTPKTVQTREVRTDLVYQVRVMVCNPAGELRLGMPATVTIALDQSGLAARPTETRCNTSE